MTSRDSRPVALVTGASRGIGEATARELARRGYALALAARSVERLEAVAAGLKRKGCPTLVVPTDLVRPDEVRRLVRSTLEHFGRIDVLINNAAIVSPHITVAQITDSGVDELIATNLTAPITLTRLVLPGMLARRSGSIVFIASVGGHIALPMSVLYSSTKFGLRGFAAGLRREVAHENINISVISPGFVTTTEARLPRFFPLAPPEQIARAIAGVIRKPRRDMIVPGYYRLFVWLDRVFPWGVDAVTRQYLRSSQLRTPRS